MYVHVCWMCVNTIEVAISIDSIATKFSTQVILVKKIQEDGLYVDPYST